MPAATDTPRTLLVVDDDADARALVRRVFERAGWQVLEAPDGGCALRALFDHRPHAVLLDLQMPEPDGWATLGLVRQVSDVPVLVVSGIDSDLEKVRALRTGADDYVTKPFSGQELIARAEAVLRRTAGTQARATCLGDGTLVIDVGRCDVKVGGKPVDLTPLEFRLLVAFAGNPGLVLSGRQLLELAWDDGIGSCDRVKVYVGYLRRKLGAAAGCIETVRGFGYRYRPAPVALAA